MGYWVLGSDVPVSSNICIRQLHVGVGGLTLATVGARTPWKSANATARGHLLVYLGSQFLSIHQPTCNFRASRGTNALGTDGTCQLPCLSSSPPCPPSSSSSSLLASPQASQLCSCLRLLFLMFFFRQTAAGPSV